MEYTSYLCQGTMHQSVQLALRARFVGGMVDPRTNCTDCCIMLSYLVNGRGYRSCTLNPERLRYRWCGCSYETVVV